jgi:glycosyltransferase involved in cell wall biosynthesis
MSVHTTKNSICLNMIVRDEALVVARCLRSVRPRIDHWVIVDTGSTDHTEQVVRRELESVPGEYFHREWRNFGENRTEAIRLAQGYGDYLLIMDADEVMEFSAGFRIPDNNLDCYKIETHLSGVSYLRRRLISGKRLWHFEGVVHERLRCDGDFSEGLIGGVLNLPRQDGARNQDPDKYEKDAALLEEQLCGEPGNSRYVFYLAQSYRDAGNYEKALENYVRRAEMSGPTEEIWYSLYQIGCLQERLRYRYSEVILSHSKAFDFLPSRAEPLRRISLLLTRNGDPKQASRVSDLAAGIPKPACGLFVEASAYE